MAASSGNQPAPVFASPLVFGSQRTPATAGM